MTKLEPFLKLSENLEGMGLRGKLKEFLGLVEEDRIKEENNECDLLKCPTCSGLLVQIPEVLPLKVRCMNCKSQFPLKSLIDENS